MPFSNFDISLKNQVGSSNDTYKPILKQTSFMDGVKDFFGGNNKKIKDYSNQYELAKAYTINKYSWNKQGMLANGINPIIASNNFSSTSSSPSSSETSTSIKDLLALLPIILSMI